MKGKLKKSVAVLLTATMVATPITAPESTKKVQAEQLGSIAKEVTGTWSYWDGNKDVVQTNKMLLDKLPTRANQGTYRFTTDNYDANTNAIDVGGFSSSMLWTCLRKCSSAQTRKPPVPQAKSSTCSPS